MKFGSIGWFSSSLVCEERGVLSPGSVFFHMVLLCCTSKRSSKEEPARQPNDFVQSSHGTWSNRNFWVRTHTLLARSWKRSKRQRQHGSFDSTSRRVVQRMRTSSKGFLPKQQRKNQSSRPECRDIRYWEQAIQGSSHGNDYSVKNYGTVQSGWP